MASKSESELIEALAADIGKEVYIDVAKWHLYLSDAKLHIPLAEQLYALLVGNTVSEEAVQTVLQGITVKLGGGKRELPLADLLPMQSQVFLMEVLEKFARQL
jgi:hypothetical protein